MPRHPSGCCPSFARWRDRDPPSQGSSFALARALGCTTPCILLNGMVQRAPFTQRPTKAERKGTSPANSCSKNPHHRESIRGHSLRPGGIRHLKSRTCSARARESPRFLLRESGRALELIISDLITTNASGDYACGRIYRRLPRPRRSLRFLSPPGPAIPKGSPESRAETGKKRSDKESRKKAGEHSRRRHASASAAQRVITPPS